MGWNGLVQRFASKKDSSRSSPLIFEFSVEFLTDLLPNKTGALSGTAYWMSVIERVAIFIQQIGFQPRRFQLKDWWSWLHLLWAEMLGVWSRNRFESVGLMLGMVLFCVFFVAPWEPWWLEMVLKWRAKPEMEVVRKAAEWLSEYGDFLGFNGMLWLLMYGFAALRKSRLLRLVLLGSVLGTVLTGGMANVFRPLVGRARPNAKVEPGFYGPQLRARYHSFPSGHTATAFGGAVPVVVALPQVGVPMVLVAGGIAWSRLFNRAHHPSDVLFSIALALLVGCPAGLAVRRAAQRAALGQALPPN